MEKSLIIINSSSIKITAEDGSTITKGEVEQGTKLKISNLSASIDGGSVTISPNLPHITTNEEMTAKKVVFTLTGIVNGETTATTTYTLDLKDVYKSSVVGMEELKTKASTYWGWDVLNYSTKSGVSLGNNEWQVFYVGKIDDTDTNEEDHIYLISKDYVENQYLPTVMKKAEGATEYTAVTGARPIAGNNSSYKAAFSKSDNNPNDGVIPQYTNSDDVDEIGQKLNNKYYAYLSANSITSERYNIRAVAYMLDTKTWGDFAGIQADYAVGGPPVELLFKAYNKYKGLTGTLACEVDAFASGYKISKDGGTNWGMEYESMIDTNSTNPYLVKSNIKADAYFLASPSFYNVYLIIVDYSGKVKYNASGSGLYRGFRPLICLNSKYTLEKTKDSNGKDAFNIVEK